MAGGVGSVHGSLLLLPMLPPNHVLLQHAVNSALKYRRRVAYWQQGRQNVITIHLFALVPWVGRASIEGACTVWGPPEGRIVLKHVLHLAGQEGRVFWWLGFAQLW